MSLFSRKGSAGSRPPRRAVLAFEQLEDRVVPAVQANFNSGVLTVLGDAANNNIRVGAGADGKLTVTENGQAVPIQVLVGNATLAQTNVVVLEGRGGNDKLATDKSLNLLVNGVLADAPDAVLRGGAGNDSLTVGHGGIGGGLAGVDPNGVVVGPVVGNAFMDGGAGDDSLTSGFGNDTILGGDGNDSYLWPPGTLTDIWDGGAGNDRATIVGNDTFLSPDPASDVFQLTANSTGVLFRRTNLVQFAVDIRGTENIVLKPGAGDDVVSIGNLAGVKHLRKVTVEGGAGNDVLDGSAQQNALISLVLLGGAGNDILEGGAGADRLEGGDGDDILDGGADCAADVLVGGSGADTFIDRCGDVFQDLDEEEGDELITL